MINESWWSDAEWIVLLALASIHLLFRHCYQQLPNVGVCVATEISFTFYCMIQMSCLLLYYCGDLLERWSDIFSWRKQTIYHKDYFKIYSHYFVETNDEVDNYGFGGRIFITICGTWVHALLCVLSIYIWIPYDICSGNCEYMIE